MPHHHSQDNVHGSDHCRQDKSVLTIRSHSGLSGDMMLTGLLILSEITNDGLESLLTSIMPELNGSVTLTRKKIIDIEGWHAHVVLPHQHEHRTLADILQLIEGSGLDETSKALAADTFTLLARAEGAVHGLPKEAVHFHEIGALDSILDICLNCALFTRLHPGAFVVSPLPMADGHIHCAHGIIPSPAPAVLEMLDGVAVRPFAASGETVTPTALALLKTLGAQFGSWPCMTVEKHTLVYGTHVFDGVPNGAVFAMGQALPCSQPEGLPSGDAFSPARND